MSEERVLHLIEFLDNSPLIEVLLDFLLRRNLLGQHRIDEVLKDLPEEEEVVALGDHEFHI